MKFIIINNILMSPVKIPYIVLENHWPWTWNPYAHKYFSTTEILQAQPKNVSKITLMEPWNFTLPLKIRNTQVHISIHPIVLIHPN